MERIWVNVPTWVSHREALEASGAFGTVLAQPEVLATAYAFAA